MTIGESGDLKTAREETKKVLLDLIVEVAGKTNRTSAASVRELAEAYALVVRPDRGNSQS
jgi:hypothetical protein